MKILEIEVYCTQEKDISSLISRIREKGFEVKQPKGINGFFVRFLENKYAARTVENLIIEEIKQYEKTDKIEEKGYTVRALEQPRAL